VQGLAEGQVGLEQRVGQVAAEVSAFARQRALELALEANGLVGEPAGEMGAQGFGQLVDQVRSAQANPITAGPMAALSQFRGQLGGEGLGPSGPAGAQLRPMPAPRRPEGNVGSTFHQVPNAPLGGPSALSRVGRPRRPTMADKAPGSY
jgi:hypothetical protein